MLLAGCVGAMQVYAGGRQFMNAVQPKYIMAELNRQYPGLQASLSVLKLVRRALRDAFSYRSYEMSKLKQPLAICSTTR